MSQEGVMVLVLGATGATGGEVARQLIAAGVRPRLLVRAPERAAAFEGHAEIVQGDMEDEGSLAAAMRGVSRMYLVSGGPDLARLERTVIDAAAASGIRHVVKLSVITAEDPQLTFAEWHGASERHLQASGLAWTMLRPGNFMSNMLGWAETIRSHGQFYQPTGTGRWPSIAPADIAAVAVRALTTSGHDGRAYTMTGAEAYDGAAYAAILATALDRPVAFVDVPLDAARASMLGGGMPPVYVEAVMDLLAAMRAGRTATVHDTIPEILGRPAITVEAWAREHADAFR